jgi:glycosyltransferase involved in cell wall biosynthesis
MGGIIYILNVIRILDFLNEDEKPEITLFYRADLKKFVDGIRYPYFQAVEWKFPSIYTGFIKSWLTGKNHFVEPLLKNYDVDTLYPLHDFPVRARTNKKLVCWYADLQHKYYPEFFTKRKLLERDLRIRYILKNSRDLVVSSQAVKDDFLKFYTIPKHLNIHIYHFVSIIDDLPEVSYESLCEKYDLPFEYFMISNQFHKHKNHKTALLALAELKKQNKPVYFVLTGRFPEKPDSPYMQELHDIINLNDLKKHISFLGLIPRGDQLLLMKHAKAIVQPSLFEGWSTVIEDAKSLQVPVIASDLPVNIEQLGAKGQFFSPHDYHRLATLLNETPARIEGQLIYEPYETSMREAATNFLSLFRNSEFYPD